MPSIHFLRDIHQPAKRGFQGVNVDYSGLVRQDFRRFFHEISSQFAKRVFDFSIQIFNRVVGAYGGSTLLQEILKLVQRDLQLIHRLLGKDKFRVAANFPEYYLEGIGNLVERFLEFRFKELLLRDIYLRLLVHTQPYQNDFGKSV
jgi:hypothetical protein